MMPFSALFERRSLENPSTPWDKIFDGMDAPTASGVSVTPDKAMGLPALFSCVQVISQDVAKTPIKFRRMDADGNFEDVRDHPIWELLHELSNPEMTAYDFKYAMQFNLNKYSVAYAQIIRNSRNLPVALWVLDPSKMQVDRDALNRKRYIYEADSGRFTWTFNPDTPPILELRHQSPIQSCKDAIGFAMALDIYGAKFFANGARLSGLLSTDAVLTDKQKQDLREQWEKTHGGTKNAFKVAAVDNGMKFTPFASQNTDAQLNEIQKYVRTIIAGLFRVPPHKIGDLERATFANIEHQAIEYVWGTLDPFYVAWEQAIKRDLLTTRQYPNYAITFDREVMIRGDLKSRMDAMAVARQNGIYSANDILRRLGENTISEADGGNAYLVNGNMIPANTAGQTQQPAPQPAGAAA
jgi:HK97 family phage portal protein